MKKQVKYSITFEWLEDFYRDYVVCYTHSEFISALNDLQSRNNEIAITAIYRHKNNGEQLHMPLYERQYVNVIKH